jgi:type IV pilus assembly protein PilY1
VANYFFDTGDMNTKFTLTQDVNGDGAGDNLVKTVISDDVKSLWQAGKELWAKSASTRTIHTSINGASLLDYGGDIFGGFYTENTRATALQPYMQAADNDSNVEAVKIINYIRGADQTSYRNRKVSLTESEVVPPPDLKEWKLGDIINSTPRIQSTPRLNTFSLGVPSGYGDASYRNFTNSSNYLSRGMVYVGANDGMMHAFKLGKLTVSGATITGDTKATLTGTDLGEEKWAYIPRNALPYLKYYTDRDNYGHLYYVDGPTLLSDMAVGSCGVGDYSDCPKSVNGSTWKTVLIGSMGLGGASKIKGDACAADVNGTCVKTPILDPANNTLGLGYSSYFALDVTDQYFGADGELAHQPTLKWEFSHPEMGYATSGAAIVRIKAKTGGIPDSAKNGKWFAVFASGPTGPIDTTGHRFMGKSNQNLKLFVIDMGATAPLVKDISYWIIDTGIPNAFGGSMLPAAIDADRWNPMADGNYQDDALYVGYAKANTNLLTAATTWTDGGVIRILTKEDPDPANWVASTVIEGVGPVTTGITRLQDRNNKKLWLFFGSGRYFYNEDDPTNLRYLVGVQDRCYTSNNTIDKNCNTNAAAPASPETTGKGKALALSDLANDTASCSDMTGKKGWYVTLRGEDAATFMGAERSITDAVPMGSGLVLYTTFMPTTDVCKFGGTSFMYTIKYDTGCIPTCTSMGGTKVMIQMSTGSFEQADMKDLFACTQPDGTILNPPTPPEPPLPPPPEPPGPNKPSYGFVGKPPADPPSSIPAFLNPPMKKIMHIRER